MIVDRMQGLHGASLPFFVSLFVFASVVCMFACVRVRSFVRSYVCSFVRLSTGKMIETGLGWGAGASQKTML
jgi:hypothetical protein